jgi:hypothetical protein
MKHGRGHETRDTYTTQYQYDDASIPKKIRLQFVRDTLIFYIL